MEPKNQSFLIDPEETILVTGSNGFLGTRVVRSLLVYGFKRVKCLARSAEKARNLESIGKEFGKSNINIVIGNLLSRETCRIATHGVSVIYHLSAGVEKSYPGCYLNSVVATRNLLDFAINESSLKRFVNIGSMATYSNEKLPRGGLLDESCEIESHLDERHEPYVYGKAKQDEIVLEYAGRWKFPYVIVRPGVIFGPGKAKITDRIGSEMLGVFLHKGLRNQIPLTYVDNCAEAVVLAGLRIGIEGQVFNITDDNLPTSRTFLKLYKRNVRNIFSFPVPYRVWRSFCILWEKYSNWSGGQLPPVFNRRACAVYWKGNIYSNRKAREMLKWHPGISMDKSLEKFFAYMRGVEAKNK